MNYIKGKYKSSIFRADETGYTVGLFRVKETDLDDGVLNKTITFTGYFPNLNTEDTYIMYGNYVRHERYGYQFQVQEYKKNEPVGEDAVYEFLTSSFIKGCGEKTARKIVDNLGEDAVKLIKEDKENLRACGLSDTAIEKIYSSIMSYYDQDEIIIELKSFGFSVKEITKILSLYGKNALSVVKNNLYSLIDFVDFNKLDSIFFKLYEENNDMRTGACILESIRRICFDNGDTYVYKEEILSRLELDFKIPIDDLIDDIIETLKFQGELKIVDNKYYLMNYYRDEIYIKDALYDISNNDTKMLNNFDNLLKSVEKEFNITYNDKQKNAIKCALENSVTIITGGPGVGKTTIINGLLRMYELVNKLTSIQMGLFTSLIAPTGRAAKRMSETTHFGASTIHRYLKWNKESKAFGINEFNKTNDEFIIVDEVSMIDNELMASLLRGIKRNIKIVFVGDEYQLPSVGPGNILKDMIDSDMFPHIILNDIYRQSENSYIPILASEIKNASEFSDLDSKHDDYNFLVCEKQNVKNMLKTIMEKSIERGLDERDVQVLAPMYKGENGIDNLNVLLQELFNPENSKLTEVHIGPIIYRVNDKVINLVNNIEQNIFNGDIGYITEINPKVSKEFMKINFYDNEVTIKREDINTIRHAYAMSIHKSQGSEFNHVVIPITSEFKRMLYNKLLYTGVSRAKKSLIVIGSKESFIYAVNNSYSVIRKTSLKELIVNKFNE